MNSPNGARIVSASDGPGVLTAGVVGGGDIVGCDCSFDPEDAGADTFSPRSKQVDLVSVSAGHSVSDVPSKLFPSTALSVSGCESVILVTRSFQYLDSYG